MTKQAMAFLQSNGLVATWKFASRYAGEGGRLATMPDIIDARLATKPGDVPWETWLTTLSAEYVGIGRSGRKIIIVAHGVGPMAELDGAVEAYRHEFDDKSRNSRGGRISAKEFRKLEDGHYGEVFVVDLEHYTRMYEYPFIHHLSAREALVDPLLHARFGGQERARAYVEHHADEARKWHKEQAEIEPEDHFGLGKAMGAERYGVHLAERRAMHIARQQNPVIVGVEDANNCSYRHYTPEADSALAHLLSLSGLTHMHGQDGESLFCSVRSHEWSNGCRFVAVPSGVPIAPIHEGWKHWRMLQEHWEELMVPVSDASKIGLRPLMQLGEIWFTGYPSKGHSVATGEPEFLVTHVEPIGGPVVFTTDIQGYYGIFRYDVKDVQAIAPVQANGFVMSGIKEVPGNRHQAQVQFYRAEVDTSRRLRQRSDVEGDYEIQMRLLAPA